MNILLPLLTAIVVVGAITTVNGRAMADVSCFAYSASGFAGFLTQQSQTAITVLFQEQNSELPPLERALVLHNLAVTQQKLGRREEAIVRLRQAVALLENARDLDPEIVLPSLNLLTALYLQMGQTQEAKLLITNALFIGKRSGKNQDVAQTWIVLAELERTTGNYGKARNAARNALKLMEPSFRNYTSLFEGVQNQLARIAYETSDHRAAATHWRLVLESMSARHPEGDEDVLSLRVDIARILVLQGRLQEAEKELALVARLAEENGRQLALGRGLYVLGMLYAEEKQPDKAEAAFLRSLTITDKELGELSADSALCLLELTKLHLKTRRPSEAAQFSARSTKVLTNSNTIPLVWLDVMQIHAQVLKKLNRKDESKEMTELVSRILALKRVGNQTIDIRDLRSR